MGNSNEGSVQLGTGWVL